MPGCKTPMGNMSKNKPYTSMTHVACESKLSSNRAFGHVLARAAHALSARIKCQYCIDFGGTIKAIDLRVFKLENCGCTTRQ